MKRNSGFTLVEMLIVIVIIGILSSALLPRLSGYMARTRDTKRQLDLRNVAAAIQMYRDQKGEFPRVSDIVSGGGGLWKHCGSLSLLEDQISSYIHPLPKDPQKQNKPYLIFTSFNKGWGNWVGDTSFQNLEKTHLKTGEYFWISFFGKDNRPYNSFLLLTKVETPEAANYVNKNPSSFNFKGGGWGLNSERYIDTSKGVSDPVNGLFLCSNIDGKVEKGKETVAKKFGDTCTYSSADQLYYVLEIK